MGLLWLYYASPRSPCLAYHVLVRLWSPHTLWMQSTCVTTSLAVRAKGATEGSRWELFKVVTHHRTLERRSALERARWEAACCWSLSWLILSRGFTPKRNDLATPGLGIKSRLPDCQSVINKSKKRHEFSSVTICCQTLTNTVTHTKIHCEKE